MRKDDAFQIFAKRLAHTGARCVVIALAVELTGAGQRMPSLEVFGNRLVQQGSLGSPLAHPQADASAVALDVRRRTWGGASVG
jgi:hypothetical protein